MKNAKYDIAFIDLEGTDLLSSPVIDYGKFYNAFQIRNMVVITNFLIDGVKQPSVQVELEKDADENIIFSLTNYKVTVGAEETIVTEIPTNAELQIEVEDLKEHKEVYTYYIRCNHTQNVAGTDYVGRFCALFNSNEKLTLTKKEIVKKFMCNGFGGGYWPAFGYDYVNGSTTKFIVNRVESGGTMYSPAGLSPSFADVNSGYLNENSSNVVYDVFRFKNGIFETSIYD